MGVQSEMQRIALEHHGRYGYRRMTAEFQCRGMLVNRKRVARIMREDSLLGAKVQLSVVSADSHGRGEIYINLGNRMKLTGVNQLWVADITFIRLDREFVYLAVVLDRFSRKIIG
jgi:putative transposase